jgi:hypothetical protein
MPLERLIVDEFVCPRNGSAGPMGVRSGAIPRDQDDQEVSIELAAKSQTNNRPLRISAKTGVEVKRPSAALATTIFAARR